MLMKMTQNELVLEYLDQFGSITPLEAMRDLGIYRLSARIADLKSDGYSIITDTVAVPNRRGGKSRIARYRLEGDTDGH